MERLIEQAARQIGIDSAEIRRHNLIPPNKLPYATPTLWNYDSGEFQRLLDKCIEISDWKGFAARKKASEKNGKLRGRAVSYYIEFGGIFNERMTTNELAQKVLTEFRAGRTNADIVMKEKRSSTFSAENSCCIPNIMNRGCSRRAIAPTSTVRCITVA